MRGTNINGIEIYVPKSFEGVIPLSPSHDFFDFEYNSFLGLKALIKPGSVVFDIGSSYGIMSCLIAKLCGPFGKVVAFEANPRVIEMANELARANAIEGNIMFINRLVSNVSRDNAEFFLVNGMHSVASTRNPQILKAHPDADRIQLETISLDDFVKQTGTVPSICKLDVEGAEFVTLEGMQRTLSMYDIDLVIETHADQILGVGGDLTTLLENLYSEGYEMLDLMRGSISTVEEYCSRYACTLGYALFSKKLKDSIFRKELLSLITKELQLMFERDKLKTTLKLVQESIDNNKDYNRCSTVLKEILRSNTTHGKANYLYAFCLHMRRHNLRKAIYHYNVALQNGFDEFWVRYNRGSLFADLRKPQEAMKDIKRALEIRPDDSGCQSVLSRIAPHNVQQ